MPNKYPEKKGWRVPKQKYKLNNWAAYNQALRHRGDIEFWISDEAIEQWYEPNQVNNGTGVPKKFSDFAIIICHEGRQVYQHNGFGSAKIDIELSRDTQISNNFFVRLGARSILATKTVNQAAIGSGLNQMQYVLRPYYRLIPGLSIFAEFERDQYYGSFKKIQMNSGNSSEENTLTFGLSILF